MRIRSLRLQQHAINHPSISYPDQKPDKKDSPLAQIKSRVPLETMTDGKPASGLGNQLGGRRKSHRKGKGRKARRVSRRRSTRRRN